MSAAAVMRWEIASLKPTQARALSEYELSSHRMPFCSERSQHVGRCKLDLILHN